MRSFSKHIYHWSRSDTIRLYPLGDVHLGNRLCAEAEFKEVVAEIEADPLARWIGMGDLVEAITRDDPRHVEESYASFLWGVQDVIAVQRERLLHLLEPIASQCLGYLSGNHERTLWEKQGRDIYRSITEKLIEMGAEAPLELGSQGLVRLYLQRKTRLGRPANSFSVTLYAAHGWGGGRLEGSLALKLGRLLKSCLADLYLFGHHHRKTLIQSRQVRMNVNNDDLYGVNLYAMGTGSFLHSYDEKQEAELYGEAKGYPPLPIGCPIVEIEPDKKDIKVKI